MTVMNIVMSVTTLHKREVAKYFVRPHQINIPFHIPLSHKKAKTNTHAVLADSAALYNFEPHHTCIPLERPASILSCLQ